MKKLISRLSTLTSLPLLATLLLSAVSCQATAAEPGSISGNVYCDADKDGTCGCEEKGLKHIPIQIFVEHCGGVALQTISTDEQGNFSFKNFQPGTYFIKVNLDYVCGGRVPTTGGCREIDLDAGATITLPAFGFSEFGG
jgi:hypothetical protein